MSYNGKSEYSKIELIIRDAAENYEIPENVGFQSLSDKDRDAITKNVTAECKKCVVGALYNDFEGKLYAFILRGNGIFLSEDAYQFISKYKEIESDVGAQIEEVSELDNDSLLLGITIDSIGVVTSILNISDLKEIEEYEMDVEVVDKNGDICNLETALELRVQLRAVYSKIDELITSVEIDDINDYNCPYCPY